MLDFIRDKQQRTIAVRLFFDWHIVSILVVVLLSFFIVAPWFGADVQDISYQLGGAPTI